MAKVELDSCPGDVCAYGMALAGRDHLVSIVHTVPDTPAGQCQNIKIGSTLVQVELFSRLKLMLPQVNSESAFGVSPADVYTFLDNHKERMARSKSLGLANNRSGLARADHR